MKRLICCLLSFAMLAQGQEKRGEEPVISSRFEVRLITVEVVVLDKDKQRVTQLSQDDFHLYVDGKPMDPAFFQEVWNPTVTSGGQIEGKIDLANRPADAKELANSYLVFIDDYFTDRRFRGAMFKKMAQDVAKLGPRDRMAVVRYDGKKLELMSDWTSDKQHLSKIFSYARELPSGYLQRKIHLDTKRDLNVPESAFRTLDEQIERISTATTIAMRSFYSKSGRRLMILMSAGWPMDFFAIAKGADEQQTANRFSPRKYLTKMIDSANLLGYTVYPMQVALDTNDVTGESPESSFTVGSRALQSEYTTSLISLWDLAHETGGQVLAKAVTKQLPLAHIVKDTSSYYVLGFMADAKGTDDRHEITVEVTRDDLKVRHRKSFRVLTRSEQVGMDMEASLMLDHTAKSLPITVGKGKRTFRRLKVPITLHIPMDWATQTPEGEKYLSELELHTISMDDQGNRSEKTITPVIMRGKKAKPGVFAKYHFDFVLSKSPQRVVLVLHDKATGKVLAHHLNLNPKDF